ncbi:MAG: hypothetical protein AAED33_08230 [Paracoccaceae bacterium]|jgi:hypothetical protein
MIKAVSLFLIAILVLGIFGKLRMPKFRKPRDLPRAKKCKTCGNYLIGIEPCKCKK